METHCPFCYSTTIDAPDADDVCYCWDCGQYFGADEAAFEPAEDQRLRNLGAAQSSGLEVGGGTETRTP